LRASTKNVLLNKQKSRGAGFFRKYKN